MNTQVFDGKRGCLYTSCYAGLDRSPHGGLARGVAALRWQGYRSDKRYIVFQCLEHTLGLGPEVWRVLDLCHQRRNAAQYEGDLEIEEQLLADLLQAASLLVAKVSRLGPVRAT